MDKTITSIDELCSQLFQHLQGKRHRIVFAESCTAGLIAGTMGRVPGVSEILTGSAVVYQLATKTAWLGVSTGMLETFGAVSQEVSEQMARGVLEITPHANIAASISGHLGPGAPPEQDGVAWSTIAIRSAHGVTCTSRQLDLTIRDEPEQDGVTLRRSRQILAVEDVIRFCLEVVP
jgi:nicotinamide-nucleotide amidase